MNTIRTLAGVVTILAATLLGMPAHADDNPCTSPLVLDLGGTGRILTTGSEHPVQFDINGDGVLDTIGWTSRDSGAGFLWIDLNLNRKVDDGSELFGSSTRLPAGGFAKNGFEALAVYDRAEFGGNEDGIISRDDVIWNRLLVWVDANHDGRSQRREIRPLDAYGVVSLGLGYQQVDQLDGNVNLHWLQGAFVKRVHLLGGLHHRQQLLEDIFFTVVH